MRVPPLWLGDHVFEVGEVDRRGGLRKKVGPRALGRAGSPRVVGLRRALRLRSELAGKGSDILAVAAADEDTCRIVSVFHDTEEPSRQNIHIDCSSSSISFERYQCNRNSCEVRIEDRGRCLERGSEVFAGALSG